MTTPGSHKTYHAVSAYPILIAAGAVLFERSWSLGWPEMVDAVAGVYASLPPALRARTGIFANDFGQALIVLVMRREAEGGG